MEPITIYERYKTIRKFLDVIKNVLIAYIIYLVVDTLAEKELIKVGLIGDFFLNLSGSITISWSITGASLLYSYITRRLCKKKTKEMGEQNDYLTKHIWPGKISSEINKDGTTRKEDRE